MGGGIARMHEEHPIMPIAICTISPECGWYMNVPLFVSANS